MIYAEVNKPNYVASDPKTKIIDLLVVYDIDGQRITIYRNDKLTYDILSYEVVNEVPDSVIGEYLLKAVNKDGKECNINLQLFKGATSYDAQLQIIYSDLYVMYNLKKLDD